MTKYNKGLINPLNLIIGVILLIAGVLYLFNNSALGALLVGIGIVIELLIKYIQKLT
ncbi:hypothetical protein HYT23_05730 [Candidatus Pacearchaeota archaeon]|nr:hypothetical protein [Candidatus Pacearchaeota archaeon]